MSERGAARKDDLHVCDAHGPGRVTGTCSGDVFVNGSSIARAGDAIECPDGTADSIFTGSAIVLVNQNFAARHQDKGFHAGGGGIMTASSDVFIGGPTVSILGDYGDRSVAMDACTAAARGRESGSTQQSYFNCGLESVRQIVNRTRRPPIGEEEMLTDALDRDLADRYPTRYEAGGTNEDGRQEILSRWGVESELQEASRENIERALAEGKGVVTPHVMAVLYGDPKQKGMHALLVTGIRYDENGKIGAYRVNDTGTGQCGKLIPADVFEKSLRPGMIADTFGHADAFGNAKMNVTKERIW